MLVKCFTRSRRLLHFTVIFDWNSRNWVDKKLFFITDEQKEDKPSARQHAVEEWVDQVVGEVEALRVLISEDIASWVEPKRREGDTKLLGVFWGHDTDFRLVDEILGL